jgi:predicted RNA binding protein YcfA (HicA-like mRNA interferase family)
LTKLPVISGKEAVKALERAGFIIIRQRGSHIRMKKIASERIIKITIPLHDILDRGTLRSIIISANLTVDEFVELL